LYKVYIEDSADGLQEKYVIAAALIATKQEWHSFSKEWKKLLKRSPSIGYFHTKEWKPLLGEFFQFRDAQRWPTPKGREAANAKRQALRALLEKSGIVAIGIAVLIPAYEKVRAERVEAKTYFPDDAFECALQEAILQCVKAVKRIDPDAQITFISDLSNKSARYTEVFNGWKEKNPFSAVSMKGIAHLDDEKVPALQAADMCANVVKQEFDKWEADKLVLPLPELSQNFYRIGYWDEKRMSNILDAQDHCVGGSGVKAF
jgi:hypothetical protein